MKILDLVLVLSLKGIIMCQKTFLLKWQTLSKDNDFQK